MAAWQLIVGSNQRLGCSTTAGPTFGSRMQPEVVGMKSEWSRWSCAARIVQVACAATAVVALAGLGVQPTDMKPVVASGVVLVDDEFDWTQQ